MNIEETILEELGKQMSESIDWEIMSGMLVEMGWTRFSLPRYIDNHHAIDIRLWVEENVQEKYQQNGPNWLFQDSKDATMFILRWGS